MKTIPRSAQIKHRTAPQTSLTALHDQHPFLRPIIVGHERLIILFTRPCLRPRGVAGGMGGGEDARLCSWLDPACAWRMGTKSKHADGAARMGAVRFGSLFSLSVFPRYSLCRSVILPPPVFSANRHVCSVVGAPLAFMMAARPRRTPAGWSRELDTEGASRR